MYQRIVADAAQQFGLHAIHIKPPQKGYRNESYAITLASGEVVNLLFYKREPAIMERIRRADAFSEAAAQTGYPVRCRYDTRTLQIKTARGVSYAALYTYLPGATIPWESYSRGHIKLLGWAMSDLHALPTSGNTNRISNEIDELLERMKAYLCSPDVKGAMGAKLSLALHPAVFKRLHRLLTALEQSTLVAPLHMDLVRGNALFAPASPTDVWQIKNVALTGVIDFEKASAGPPILDIARTLAFLLVDCPLYSAAKIEKYFVVSGYNKRGTSQFDYAKIVDGYTHYQLLHGLVGLFLLHDFYKFLRHTPYESLAENHHYTRTRDMLIQRDMLRYS